MLFGRSPGSEVHHAKCNLTNSWPNLKTQNIIIHDPKCHDNLWLIRRMHVGGRDQIFHCGKFCPRYFMFSLCYYYVFSMPYKVLFLCCNIFLYTVKSYSCYHVLFLLSSSLSLLSDASSLCNMFCSYVLSVLYHALSLCCLTVSLCVIWTSPLYLMLSLCTISLLLCDVLLLLSHILACTVSCFLST